MGYEEKTKEQLIMELEELQKKLIRHEEAQRIANVGNLINYVISLVGG